MAPTTKSEQERARVLIVESAELVRQGIRGVLTRDRQFVVVEEIARPQEMARACADRSPDLVFLGLGRDGSDRAQGLTALRDTLRGLPSALIIVLVDGDAEDDLLAPAQAGASGVLLRNAPADTVLEAARHVLEGGCVLDPHLTRKLFDQLSSELRLSVATVDGPSLDMSTLRSLSPREREVLQLLCQGLRNKAIAARLGVTIGTVKTHLRHIFRKLKVDDRTGAVLTALRVRLREAA